MDKSRYLVPTVSKSITILNLLVQRPNLSQKQIRSELDLPNGTCFNILTTLESYGMIERDPTTSLYRLGPHLIHLGFIAYKNFDVRSLSLPILKRLNALFDETVYLTILDKSSNEGIVIEKLDSSQTTVVVRQLGEKVPLYASCTGKSLLSGFDEYELERYLRATDFVKLSSKTITEQDKLRNEVETIKRKGYAITQDEWGDGATAVSSPVRDYTHRVIAAISLSGPTPRMEKTISEMIQHIQTAANEISTKMGYSP